MLLEIAREIRLSTLETIAKSGKGHYGGAFSCIEILTALYFGGMEKNDRFILSKGHAGSALYCTLAKAGVLDPEELGRLNNQGLLGEEPHKGIPGVEVNTGSLGHGFGLACGMALAHQRDGSDARIFVLLGDGECWEGSVWEAAMFAAHHRLNITLIIDRNGLAIGGDTESIIRHGNLGNRLMSFGIITRQVDGHDTREITQWLAVRSLGPLAIIANTTKGKGVSFMEGQAGWHHGSLSPEQLDQARAEIGA